MKGFPVRSVPCGSGGEDAKAVARRQAEQLTVVRRRAQPTAVYIARLTLTAVFAYLLALQLPGGSTRSVLAPLTALLVVQATLFHTIRSAIQKGLAVTAGVLAAVAVAAYGPFSGGGLGPLPAGTLVPGIVLRPGEAAPVGPVRGMRRVGGSGADGGGIGSGHGPVGEAEPGARLAAVIAELSAAVRAYGQLLEADPVPGEHAAFAAEPITEALEDHLEEAQRQQDQLADLLSTDPAERPEGWQLRGEILAHVDRLRSELEPGHLPGPAQVKPGLLALRERHRNERRREQRREGERYRESPTGPRRRPNRAPLRVRAKAPLRVRARRTAPRVRARRASLAPPGPRAGGGMTNLENPGRGRLRG